MRHDLNVGEGAARRRVAVLARPGRMPPVVWLDGFRSEMRATKADALDSWAAGEGRAFLRFDYTGHGLSGGDFAAATVTRWLEDTMAVLSEFAPGRPILVGSSMGGWLALLAARALGRQGRPPAALVLIAPATDFTERLMWDAFPAAIRETISRDGVYLRPSAYAEEPTPITRELIEDGRRHLILGGPIELGCPVHILQGMRDPDVPWEHALRLVERLPGDNVQLTLVKDGDHRLSRSEDLDRLRRAVDAAIESAAACTVSSG